MTPAIAPLQLAPLVVVPKWTALGPAPIPNGQTQAVCSGGPTPGASCNTSPNCGAGGVCNRSDPVSGRVTAIAIHPTDANKVYVGTAQGGVYRSLDGGVTWSAILDDALSLAIGAISIAPSNPTTVFVGTGEPNFSFDSYAGVGVYRVDTAETTPTLAGPLNQDAAGNDIFTGASISRILVDPNDANTIFVSTVFGRGGIGGNFPATIPPRGIYRSTDALAANPTFTRLNVPTAMGSAGDVTDMVLDPGNSNNLVCGVSGTAAAGDGGLWRSTDALAANPTFVRTLAIGNNTRVELAIDNIAGAVTVLAATGEGSAAMCPAAESAGGVLRRSTDGGATWPTTLGAANAFCDNQCFYDMAAAMDPGNAGNIYIGGAFRGTCSRILIRSTDGGTMFANSDTGLHVDTHVVAVAPSNALIVYTGNDGGIWKSVDAGVNWTSLNNTDFSATQFNSLALHATDRNFMIGGTQDNGTELMMPNGTWTRADFGDGGYAQIDQNAADTVNVTMYHTYFNRTGFLIGFARVTTTAGAFDGNWMFLGASTPPGMPCASNNGISCTDTVLFYAPMTLGPGNPNTLYFGTDRLYRSINTGTTMVVVSQQFAPTACRTLMGGSRPCAVSAIGISPQNDSVRLVGLENGAVFATTTGANPLTNVTGPIPGNFVARSILDPNNANTAYVALAGFGLPAGQHIWRTTNLGGGGATWAASGTGIPDVPVNALIVDPNDSNALYAGTDIGVFRSGDGGANWNPFGSGLPRVAVWDIAIQNPNRILRAATHGRGIYELDLNPDCSAATANPAELWPPRRRFVDVTVDGVVDPLGSPVTITITGITQDEPLTGRQGAGRRCPDGAGVGTATASLRAERIGRRDGRVYQVSFRANNTTGGQCTGIVTVCVPHDQRPGHACIDEGPLFDSTGPCG